MGDWTYAVGIRAHDCPDELREYVAADTRYLRDCEDRLRDVQRFSPVQVGEVHVAVWAATLKAPRFDHVTATEHLPSASMAVIANEAYGPQVGFDVIAGHGDPLPSDVLIGTADAVADETFDHLADVQAESGRAGLATQCFPGLVWLLATGEHDALAARVEEELSAGPVRGPYAYRTPFGCRVVNSTAPTGRWRAVDTTADPRWRRWLDAGAVGTPPPDVEWVWDEQSPRGPFRAAHTLAVTPAPA